jgi:hypothetical protein
MLGALLWAQGALAGYLCPGGSQTGDVASMVQNEMPCAGEMSAAVDDEGASLCHAHCQTGHSSADSYQPPGLATAVQLGAVLTIVLRGDTQRPPGVPDAPLRREGDPPLAISYCCFRI